MTSRERLVAAARGGTVDQTPVITLDNDHGSDAQTSGADPHKINLFKIENPFATARTQGLLERLREDPEQAQAKLDLIVSLKHEEIACALNQGGDGILYVLQGAEPAESTPMEYGGLFLERDREILSAIEDAPFNVVFVDAGEGAYLDFVSDLPCHVLAWDYDRTNVPPSTVRPFREGAIATAHEDADILFAQSFDRVEPLIRSGAANHAS